MNNIYYINLYRNYFKNKKVITDENKLYLIDGKSMSGCEAIKFLKEDIKLRNNRLHEEIMRGINAKRF